MLLSINNCEFKKKFTAIHFNKLYSEKRRRYGLKILLFVENNLSASTEVTDAYFIHK